MRVTLGRLLTAVFVTALASSSLTACGASDSDAIKIALLLPDSKTARYETFDKPYFTDRINELGDASGTHYEVLYSNADQDASKQQSQAEAALASGVSVLVLDPVDGAASVSIVAAANAQDVPVIAYDRFISGGQLAFYVSFDNDNIGHLQATALVDQLDRDEAQGGILMVNGSPTDNNAVDFKAGAHSVIDGSDYQVLAEFDTPDWSPDKAQDWVASQITQYGDRIAAVYAANDGTASGAIAALHAANVVPWPVVTGQDADLAAIQSIVSGDQYMTIYKDIKKEAEVAAEMAVRLASGDDVVGQTEIDGTPSTLLGSVIVTLDTIMSTVVADGVYTVAEICTPEYAQACEEAGIE
ncbi:sugar ABC transporter substrate-binding protein [soil metagenome]